MGRNSRGPRSQLRRLRTRIYTVHTNRITAPIFHGRNLSAAEEAEIEMMIDHADALLRQRRERVLAEIDAGASHRREALCAWPSAHGSGCDCRALVQS